MNNNSHTNKYIIKNYLVKNINLTWDIVISEPEFLKKNISNVQFFLTNETDKINEQQSTILDNYLFKIIFKSSTIYSNYLKSNQDIFEYSDIPFEYIYYHTGFFILENIPLEIIELIMDWKINFVYVESNILQHYPPNISPNAHDQKWNIGIEEKYPDKNFLRIMAGMIGTAYKSYYINENFYTHNHKIIYDSDNLEHNLLKISYLDEQNNWVQGFQNEIDIYSMDKFLNVLVDKKNTLIEDYNNTKPNANVDVDVDVDADAGVDVDVDAGVDVYAVVDVDANANANHKLNEFFEIAVETLKIPLNKICFDNTIHNTIQNTIHNKFISTIELSITDGITNILFLCNNKKYIINKIYLDLEKITHTNPNPNIDDFNYLNKLEYKKSINTHEIEYDLCEEGYIILGLSDFFLIPTVINNSNTLRIEFEINEFEINDFDPDSYSYSYSNSNSNIILSDNNYILSDLFDDFWIKYDRILMNTTTRRKIAQLSQDYEEYPIVDILEYIPINQNHEQNIINNQNIQNNINQNFINNKNNKIIFKMYGGNNLNNEDNEDNLDYEDIVNYLNSN